MKVTVIGAGNMGGAIAEGLVRAGKAAGDITVTAAHQASLEKFAAKGIRCTTDNREAVYFSGAVQGEREFLGHFGELSDLNLGGIRNF